MKEEDIKYYNDKMASDSKVVMPADEAIEYIKEYMKELLDRDDYDIEDLKDDISELADYIKDITDSEAEFIVIRECPMTATNITIEPLEKANSSELYLVQLGVWCMNNLNIESKEDIPTIFTGRKQELFRRELLNMIEQAQELKQNAIDKAEQVR